MLRSSSESFCQQIPKIFFKTQVSTIKASSFCSFSPTFLLTSGSSTTLQLHGALNREYSSKANHLKWLINILWKYNLVSIQQLSNQPEADHADHNYLQCNHHQPHHYHFEPAVFHPPNWLPIVDALGPTTVELPEICRKGLFTYYVSQNKGFLDPPSPLRQQWSAFGLPPHSPSSAFVSICLTPLLYYYFLRRLFYMVKWRFFIC